MTVILAPTAIADYARHVVELTRLSKITPERLTAPAVSPRPGDLAVVMVRDIPRYAIVQGRCGRRMEALSMLTSAAIARAGLAARHVTGTVMAPDHPDHVAHMTERARRRACDNAGNSDLVVWQVAEAARVEAYRDSVVAAALTNRGLPWWACWAKITTLQRPSGSLVIIRD